MAIIVETVEIWEKSCFDCAVKRGWTTKDTPGIWYCPHRLSIEGEIKVCAGWRSAVKAWEEFKQHPNFDFGLVWEDGDNK